METMKQIEKHVKVVEAEGKDALWRTAALKLVDTAKVPFKAAAKAHLPEVVTDLVDTQYGKAGFAYALGVGLSASPWGNEPKGKRLAYELRVYGMTILSSKLSDVVFVPIKDTIAGVLAALPEVK